MAEMNSRGASLRGIVGVLLSHFVVMRGKHLSPNLFTGLLSH